MVNPGIMKVNKLINPTTIVKRTTLWTTTIIDGDNPIPVENDSKMGNEQALNEVNRRMLNKTLYFRLLFFFFNDL
jgi:hypothetical protein